MTYWGVLLSRRDHLRLLASAATSTSPCANIYTVPQDLELPSVTIDSPKPGRRISLTLPQYRGSEVHHVLYLPVDWKPGRRYPILAEYAGNGGYQNADGDRSSGRVEDSALGYGISAGKGFLWLCLPFVDSVHGTNALTWWGDVGQTVEYCCEAIESVCRDFGGDRDRVVLLGFSRGAIACNYIGLHDDRIAGLWRGFVAHSHYDGVRSWPYPESGRSHALERLRRLNGRPVFISQECSVDNTRSYVESNGVRAPFRYLALPYRNHTDRWVLRDLPARRELRSWVRDVVT